MELQLNGKPYHAPEGLSIAELLTRLDLDPQRVVVEINRRILTVDQHRETRLAAGDTLEIVQFVGGG